MHYKNILFTVIATVLAARINTPTNISTTTTETSTTTVATTTDIPCSPACNSQQACVQNVCVGMGHLSCTMIWSRTGDADIVIATPNNKIIYYNNAGPTALTDQGRLDVDNTNGTGPENVFWSYTGTVPSTGTYYVCLSQYHFNPNVTSANPITATLKIMRSTNSTLIFTKTM